MYSTVRDMLQWAQNFDDARVGTPALLAAMQKPGYARERSAEHVRVRA
jgi:hypothetical protein